MTVQIDDEKHEVVVMEECSIIELLGWINRFKDMYPNWNIYKIRSKTYTSWTSGSTHTWNPTTGNPTIYSPFNTQNF